LIQLFLGRKFNVDFSDRLFYALIPALGYVLGFISAVLLLIRSAASVNLMAAALLTLLLAGIRNAWDMLLWIVIKTPSSRAPSP
jgi:hypothetical protein